MIVLGLMAHCIAASLIIVLLLDRGTFGAEKTPTHSTSPWFPAGPPPSKPPASSDALKTLLPLVTFDCRGKTGYFPDAKFNCEVFHYCKTDGTRNTFTCPAHSIFNQLSMVCEEKTPFNARICKEGSIGIKKKDRTLKQPPTKPPAQHGHHKKYREDVAKQHRMLPSSSTKSPNYSRTTAATKTPNHPASFVLALEDLLGYMNMNSDQQARKTFDPNDQVSGGVVTSPSTSTKKFSTSSVPFESVKITGKKFSKVLSNVSVDRDGMQTSESRVLDDFSKEYDAIEGKRPRQLKKVGRVLDVKDGPHKRSHVQARSPTEAPPPKTVITTSPPDPTTLSATTLGSSPPSLFSADRSKAKDFRKRRRNLNRRRKIAKDSEVPDDVDDVTETTPHEQDTRTDSVESASHNYAKHMNPLPSTNHHVDGEMSLSWMGLSKSGKVEPYTLPPLPIPQEDGAEFTPERHLPTTQPKRKRTRTRRPMQHTTTPPMPNEDMMLEMKFGEKISELSHHHYGLNDNTKSNHTDHSDIFGFEDIVTEDFIERHPTSKPRKIASNNSKQRDSKKQLDTDERFFHYPLTSPTKKLTIAPEDLFPPPRAEPREQKSVDSQQLIYDKSSTYTDEETTTEDPVKTTYSYVGRHRTRPRDQLESDRLKWRISEDKRKRKDKIEVGSTFSLAPESTARPRLQVPPTEDPLEADSVKSKKEQQANGMTSAHQHLLKLMNDFFAMSSSKGSAEESEDERDREEDMADDNGSEEDMHRGESITINEEMEDIPPELLDVVDFISEQSDEDKRNLKHEDSHEIIKISGPITNKHLKEILSDNFQHRKKARNENKFVVVPSGDKENLKDLAEVAQFASVRLGPLLKHMASEKTSVTMIPMKIDSEKKPAVMSAKKIPVRVFYKEQASTPMAHRATPKPMLKVVRSQLPNPSLQIIHNGRISPSRTYSQPHYKPKHQQSVTPRPVIIHPKSMYPPHPPPLHKKTVPFKFGFPFVGNNRPLINHMRYRKKRSVLKRERRQLQPNPSFLPFPRPVFPPFNPKFAPTFSPFKNIFAPNGLSTAGSNHNPFTFPKFDIRKPNFGESPTFKFPNSPPAPVRHITQAGDQTVIVEEVPVPIHVEVPDPNLLRPVHPGNHRQNLVNPFPTNNQFRNPSPPAIQPPPLMQGFQGRFPVTNNYRPFGMPSNVRPPVMNYQPSLQFSPPLPPTITNQGQLYALGVTTKPFLPSKPPPSRSPNAILGVPPGPPQHFQVHSNSYPNYPYFQGSFTTPIANDPVPGRVMYSGYKPPKSTPGTKLPRTTRMPNRERNAKPENINRPPSSSRPRPSQSYYYVTQSPSQEYYNNYKAPRGRTPTKSYGDATSPSTNTSNGSPYMSENPVPRRRPYKKRRPRPSTTSTTSSAYFSKDISPTPPPAEQIPPPLADFTSLPLQHQAKNSLQNNKDASKPTESSNLYPPAGYYGKDQLVQFFDSSSKSFNKASTPKSIDHNDLGENTSSAELDETVTSLSSGEDSDLPAFGTRLKAKPDGQRRKKKRQQIQSPTQKSEVRTRPSNTPDDAENRKRQSDYINRKPIRNQQVRDDNTNGQRRPQYRGRPTSMPSRKPEVHHYKYDGNTGGFYSVPSGLQGLVDPSHRPSQGPGSTDMFGIPHPSMDKNIYSLRPQGASGDFNSNFFSVPSEVAQQQKSSLHIMNTRPMPDSAREFFEAAAKESSNYKNAETSEKKEEEKGTATDDNEDKKQQRNPQVVRKLRKPKRKNRYNPRTNEEKLSSDTSTPGPSQSAPSQRNSKDRATTPATTTTTNEPYPTYIPTEGTNSPNDIKEQQAVFKPRAPLLPKTLPDLSQKLQNGKIDFKKLNATISTSVSVSGAFPQQQQSSNESSEDSSKRVFSSQNGGLAVVRSNPKRKRTKQKLDRFGSDEESSTKTKYDIAASVLDIIKATAESEKLGGTGFYSHRYGAEPAASNTSNVWDTDPTRIDYNRTTTSR